MMDQQALRFVALAVNITLARVHSGHFAPMDPDEIKTEAEKLGFKFEEKPEKKGKKKG